VSCGPHSPLWCSSSLLLTGFTRRMWVMSANTGMMVGTWYYRAADKPSL